MAKHMKKYVVEAKPDKGWWLISVPELDGIASHATSFKNVKGIATDLIAVWLDVKPSSFEVEVQVKPPTSVRKLLNKVSALQEQAEDIKRKTNMVKTQAAKELLNLGLTTREAAEILQVSHQRVSQLAAG